MMLTANYLKLSTFARRGQGALEISLGWFGTVEQGVEVLVDKV